MGLAGWVCPSHGESPGRKNEFNYCLTECKHPCTAPHVLEALRKSESENYHTGKTISATMLTGGCKRKTALERLVPYYVEPDDKLPTFRGTLIHSLVEKGRTDELNSAGWLVEQHLALPVKTTSGEWILTGTLDAYDPSRDTLFDIKTLQEYSLDKLIKGKENGTWSKHISDPYVKQLNIYRYMAKQLKLFKAKRLRLQVIGFGRMILTGTTVLVKTFRKGSGVTVDEFSIPDVPLLPDKLIKSWIESEGDDWYQILYGSKEPPICSEDWAWLCKKCVFNGSKSCPDPEKERRKDDWV